MAVGGLTGHCKTSKGLGKTQRVGRKCEAYSAEKQWRRITLR
jgi:hypothetical protein